MAWLNAATSRAQDRPVAVPVASWSSPHEVSGLGPRSAVVSGVVAKLMEAGVRPYVASLWFLVGSLGLLALAVGWAAGGAGGASGGLLAAVLLLASPLGVDVGTAFRGDALLAALVAAQLGVMAYRPGWTPVQGGLAALAWSVAPAGLGGVAAAVLWPWAPRWGCGREAGGETPAPALASLGGIAPAWALLALGPRMSWLPTPAPGGEVGFGGVLDAASGVLAWAATIPGAETPPMLAIWSGLAVVAGAVTLVVAEATATPRVPADLAWDHPQAPDLVAARLRSAGWLLALALLLAGAISPTGGMLHRPALALVAVTATLVGAAAARWLAGSRGWGRILVAVPVGLWLLISAGRAATEVPVVREDGRGVTSAAWLESEVVRWLDNRAPAGMPIYASEPYGVLIQTGRPARTLPAETASLDGFSAVFQRRPGAVVLTGSDTLHVADFRQWLAVREVARDELGVVLVRTPRSAP